MQIALVVAVLLALTAIVGVAIVRLADFRRRHPRPIPSGPVDVDDGAIAAMVAINAASLDASSATSVDCSSSSSHC